MEANHAEGFQDAPHPRTLIRREEDNLLHQFDHTHKELDAVQNELEHVVSREEEGSVPQILLPFR